MKNSFSAAATTGLLAIASILGYAGPLEVCAGNTPHANADQAKETHDVKQDARVFLKSYQTSLAELEIKANLAAWKAANSGKKEDFAAAAQAKLALRKFHSDPDAYGRVQALMQNGHEIPAVEARALHLAELAYRRNQLPAVLLEQMVELSTQIEQTFSTFRAEMDDKPLSNNDLLALLREEDDSRRRELIWVALKQVGDAVAPRLVQLATLRNRAARRLGFDNYWEMGIRLQEHDPEQLLTVFDELERLTRKPFGDAKGQMDRELARRFGIAPQEMMPWHYDNPFFQAAPPSDKVDLNEFYEDKTKEGIVKIARAFFADVGLPADAILRRSDLYERAGKNQHAFCMNVDRAGDVRTLCNVKPTAEWMDTTLHELGHAVYDLHIDRRLPFNLREPAHIFTTEGVAMLFGALGKNPTWMVAYAGAEKTRVNELTEAILEQRRREQLVFARWTLVMLHFEKSLYENPQQDLNALWWNYVERFQQLKRPAGRNRPDWAAKPHFTIAPVYYHNYMLGELFAAQLRHTLLEVLDHDGPTAELSFRGRKELADFFKQKVFNPGSVRIWPEFVARATGEPLTAKYFAAEVRRR